MDYINKLLQRFKLGNSLYKGQWKITNETLYNMRISKEEVEAMAVREMVIQLSDKIMKEHPKAIVEEKFTDYNLFKVQLLVLEMKDFKDIVEGAIGMLSDAQIEQIRQGLSVNTTTS